MATYKAGNQGSPDGKYLVCGHIRGAYGHAFIDQTAKTVFVAILAGRSGTGTPEIRKESRDGTIVETVVKNDGKEKSLLQRKYRVQGSDVCWDAIWDKDDNLTLVFYDYGTGVSFYDARKNGTPKRQIRTVTYAFDSNTGTFSEQPAK